jgi:uncharacterized membrane protein YadS
MECKKYQELAKRVAKNLDKNWSTELASKMLNTTTPMLNIAFQNMFSVTFPKYVLRLRMDVALRMFLNGKRLADIAKKTGFSTPYALSATFLFDMAMIVLFPIMGRAMNLSDIAYGLWAGTAVNDTSSVVAAGFAYSEAAGDFATMVKLTRTLSIIPVVVIFALINARLKQKAAMAQGSFEKISAKGKVKFTSLFPWFILGFVALAVVNSFGVIPAAVSAEAKSLSKFLMVSALAAIGLNTSFKQMSKSGPKPMLHGFIISALVVVVAIAVEFCMGMV